ncbi:hypothetical protein EBU95_07990 [bacterium]|nr:hypothetical protein [bacterium]
MVDLSKKEVLKQVIARSYLNKDFTGFRNEMETYLRSFYGDKIKDLSPGSFMGMFLDTVAFIGDTQSYYLDHQFHELSPETAVEPRNVERLLRDNRVPMTGATPSVVECTFRIKVPALLTSSPRIIDPSAIPIINQGTKMQSKTGIPFELTENLNFTKKDGDGQYIASVEIAERDSGNLPTSFFMSLNGVCISGEISSESFTFAGFEPFKLYTLSRENITQIISVVDDSGNIYYEVDSLANDTVYLKTKNLNSDSEEVESSLQIQAAPYRYVKLNNLSSGLTTLRFGGGNAETTDNDIIPDPSEFSLPLYGQNTFSRYSINPNNLLRTNTVGTIVPNSTITITYRFGGGLRHNVGQGSIANNIIQLLISFPNSPTTNDAVSVRNSVKVNNNRDASGGLDPLSLTELQALIPSFAAAQSRVVEQRDLLARIYTMPSSFGRVFRAAARPNPANPNSSLLYVASKAADGTLTLANDTLKRNLAKYLNDFRIIPDAIDILDVSIINFKVEYQIAVDNDQNRMLIIENVNKKLKKYFNVTNFQIDQVLNLSEIQNIIYNNIGVMSVQFVRLTNLSGTQGERSYSPVTYNFTANTNKNMIIPPPGGMFELKYPDVNIKGSLV